MANIANITVKKNDGTTDQIWTAVQASGGDKSPAIWRNQSVGAANSFMPEMRMQSRSNQDGSLRRLEGVIDWKQSATGSDGVVRKINVATLSFNVGMPQSMPSADTNEFVAQATNLIASALIKQSLKDGFAPV